MRGTGLWNTRTMCNHSTFCRFCTHGYPVRVTKLEMFSPKTLKGRLYSSSIQVQKSKTTWTFCIFSDDRTRDLICNSEVGLIQLKNLNKYKTLDKVFGARSPIASFGNWLEFSRYRTNNLSIIFEASGVQYKERNVRHYYQQTSHEKNVVDKCPPEKCLTDSVAESWA